MCQRLRLYVAEAATPRGKAAALRAGGGVAWAAWRAVSARMKPFSKSEWITPAACGARMPPRIVHALVSVGPGHGRQTRHGWGRVGVGCAPPARPPRSTMDYCAMECYAKE